MNYLGHAFFSDGDAALLTGNMIADHVKGLRALEQFPEGIRDGIVRHRRIDHYADHHHALLRARIYFRPVYGLYSGAIVDTLTDHFLANDARYFKSADTLRNFSAQVYAQLGANEAWFPPDFARYFSHMREHDWLYHYRNVGNMQQVLKGLARRAKSVPDPEEAYQTFIFHYYLLEQCYYEFIDDMVRQVKAGFPDS